MRKLSVIILASILSFATISCGDDEGGGELPSTSGIWILDSMEFQDNDGNETFIETDCEIQSTITFREDGTFSRSLYVLDEGNCVQYDQSGTWSENDNRELTLNYTQGENIQDPNRFQVTDNGLEESIVFIDQDAETIESILYTYKKQ